MKPFSNYLLIFAFLSAPLLSFATGHSLFDQLVDQEFKKLNIYADFDRYLKESRTNDIELEANLQFRNKQGKFIQTTAEIEPRGKFRRMNCDIPPIKIKFSKEWLAENGFNPKFKKHKLVLQCKDTDQQAVLKEYWAYKLYNQLTPASFRVQLLEIALIDINTTNKVKFYGFMIESNNQVEDRVGAEFEDQFGLHSASVDANVYGRNILFQYMIGNSDWALATCRNLKVYKIPGKGKYGVIPYDFDFSGLVNASYAVPNINFNQKKVTQRVVVDRFNDQTSLRSTINSFRKQFDQKDWKFEDCEHLTLESKLEMDAFLAGFLSVLNNEKKLGRLLL